MVCRNCGHEVENETKKLILDGQPVEVCLDCHYLIKSQEAPQPLRQNDIEWSWS